MRTNKQIRDAGKLTVARELLRNYRQQVAGNLGLMFSFKVGVGIFLFERE
jgi:hypothetical protein